MLKTKEFYEIIESFEKEYRTLRLDREPKELWQKQNVYQDGFVNSLFGAYLRGYSLGKAMAQ